VDGYDRRAASRSVVGSCRTVLVDSTQTAQRGVAARFASRVPHWLSQWHSLADAPTGTWVRVGDDVLAARLATDGVWDLIHFALLDWLARGGHIDWSLAVVDSCSIRAVYDGDQTGPSAEASVI
jgi:hypothetical protein